MAVGVHRTLHQAAVEGEGVLMLLRTAQLAEAVAAEAPLRLLPGHGCCLPLTGYQTGFWNAKYSGLHRACSVALCALCCPC